MRTLTDIAAERAVLCGLYQYGQEMAVEVEDLLTSDCFTDVKNEIIYKCLSKSLENTTYVDKSTLLSKATELNLYEQLNNSEDLEFINSLDRFRTEKDNVLPLAKKLRRLKIARDLNKELYIIKSKLSEINGTESLNDILAIAENGILDFCESLGDSEENSIEKFGDNIEDFLTHLVENRSDIAGIPTGFLLFDKAIGGGLRRGGVTLVGARPKTGKTTLACQVGLNVSEENIPVLILDTEMDKDSLICKQLANISGIKIDEVELGHFGDDNDRLLRVREAGQKLKDIPLYYKNIAGQDFESILPYIRRWVKKEVGYDEDGRLNDCVVVYDYFKIMDGGKITESMKEYQALGFQLSKMVNFCIKNEVPCLAFVQLNREGGISQSDRLEWFAESVSFLTNKTTDEIAQDGMENGNLKINVMRQRYGEGLTEGNYINVMRQGEIARMTEINTKNDTRGD